MRFFSALAAIAMVVVTSAAADAGVYASSLLRLSNARVQRSDDNSTWVDATTADIGVVAVVNTTRAAATIGALSADTGNLTGTLDAPQQYVGDGDAPVENSMTLLSPSGNTFARTDTNGGGTLLTAGGAFADTLTELQSVNGDLGISEGNANGFNIVQIQVNRSGFYRLIYDATLDMEVEAIGPPNSLVASATSSFNFQLSGVGLVGIDFPDPNLTVSISTTGANVSYNYAATGLTTDSRFLTSSLLQVYQFTLNQSTTASIGAVPEPTSMAIFGVMGVSAVVARRRRRKNA